VAGERQAKRDVDGILLLDKPLGISSNHALQQVKRAYRAARAGHTGSLDPLATGMLPVCLGQATKLCGYLLESDKRYAASVTLGAKTSTGDAEGEIIERSDPSRVTAAMLEEAMRSLTGRIRQVPPMHSALKHEGRRLYELAREGVEVERKAREVTIHELRLSAFDLPRFDFDVRCSKGTYIRTLAEDIAAAIGQCAHLSGLRRLEVAPFGAGPLVSAGDIERAAGQGEAALDALLLPPSIAVTGWAQVRVDEDTAFYLGRGQAVRIGEAPSTGLVAVISGTGKLLGIAEAQAGGMLAPRRWLSGGDPA
jgi:tRNA pseudouridine55 synthase